MHTRDRSVTDFASRFEDIRPEVAQGALQRLSRRQFLRRGALTAAGLATVSGLDLLRPSRALAQAAGTVFGERLFLDLSAAVFVFDGDGTNPMRLCRHIYEFDYVPGPDGRVPPNLVKTSRLRRLSNGSFQPFELTMLPLRESPFGSIDDYEQSRFDPDLGTEIVFSFPPAPDGISPNDANGPFLVLCYRHVARNADGRSLHVIDWCSFYSAVSRDIEINLGNQRKLRYSVRDLRQPGNPPETPNYDPQPSGGWASQRTKDPRPHEFLYTRNSRQGMLAIAVWWSTFEGAKTERRLEAYIPRGAATPLTRNAQYLVTNARAQALLHLDQRGATPGSWVPLHDAQGNEPHLTFNTGSFQVRLVDTTGEDARSTFVVASGMRWKIP